MESFRSPPRAALPLSQQDLFLKPHAPRQLRQRVPADQGSAQFGEDAFLRQRIMFVKMFGDDEPQEGVAEEFEALVVLGQFLLQRVRGVDEGKSGIHRRDCTASAEPVKPSSRLVNLRLFK